VLEVSVGGTAAGAVRDCSAGFEEQAKDRREQQTTKRRYECIEEWKKAAGPSRPIIPPLYEHFPVCFLWLESAKARRRSVVPIIQEKI
jgi:hypothetical protein